MDSTGNELALVPMKHPRSFVSITGGPTLLVDAMLVIRDTQPLTLIIKYEAMLGIGDLRNQQCKKVDRIMLFRSKNMTADEIETILRMQLAATHSNDPYMDDYYYRACLAKKSSEARLKHHLCPTHLRELPPRARANIEPHAFLQVDALERVPLSSIRIPRPLLEEPMLAARVAIEDGLCLLLDLQDGGTRLRRRWQTLLEGLATSLQLVDPLGKHAHADGLAPRMILCSYDFYLVLPSDSGATETTTNLSRVVSSCVRGMDLSAVSVCLTVVVCSSKQPPFRPRGSSTGDGASVILKSVFEMATEILIDPHVAGNCNMNNRALWQASFDEFFGLLTKYCLNKYDGIMQSLLMQALFKHGRGEGRCC
ncbi:hypothetical protein AAG906_029158 [Vitis piasezkii]